MMWWMVVVLAAVLIGICVFRSRHHDRGFAHHAHAYAHAHVHDFDCDRYPSSFPGRGRYEGYDAPAVESQYGKFSDPGDPFAPQACPAGASCGQEGLDKFVACPDNTYTSDLGSAACKVCPPGKICSRPPGSAVGATATAICPAGKVCPGPDPVTGQPQKPTECTPGYFCPAGAAAPTPCPAGQSCAGTALAEPAACPPNFYCPGPMADGKTPQPDKVCPLGSMCTATGTDPKTGAVGPQVCKAGSYCSDYKTTAICPAGTYCPAGSPAPVLCPAGFSSQTVGAETINPCLEKTCPAGKFCPQGSSAPKTCPAGYFCPAAVPVLVSGTVVMSTQAPKGALIGGLYNEVPAGVSVPYNILPQNDTVEPLAKTRLTVRVNPNSASAFKPFQKMPSTVPAHPVATTFTTDASGNFSIYLPPGNYSVVNDTKADQNRSAWTISQTQWANFALFTLNVLPPPYTPPTSIVSDLRNLPACAQGIVPGVVTKDCANQLYQNAGCTSGLDKDSGWGGDSRSMDMFMKGYLEQANISQMKGDNKLSQQYKCYGRYANYGNNFDFAATIAVPVPSIPGYTFTILLNPADLVLPPVRGMLDTDVTGSEVFSASHAGLYSDTTKLYGYDVADGDDANNVCNALNGSTVATLDQLMKAATLGASWPGGGGWTKDKAPTSRVGPASPEPIAVPGGGPVALVLGGNPLNPDGSPKYSVDTNGNITPVNDNLPQRYYPMGRAVGRAVDDNIVRDSTTPTTLGRVNCYGRRPSKFFVSTGAVAATVMDSWNSAKLAPPVWSPGAGMALGGIASTQPDPESAISYIHA